MNTHDDELPPIELGDDVRKRLARTPPFRWNALALLVHVDGRVELLSRGDLAAWLRSNDLESLAREALNRRVPREGMLVLSVRQEPRFSVLRFDDVLTRGRNAR